MKKIICILLIAVMCLGICGCSPGSLLHIMGFNSDFNKKDIKKYLNEKYGEEFVVGNSYAPNTSTLRHSAVKAYPVGKENDEFIVYFFKDNSGKIVYSDGYYIVLAEKELFPVYQDWINKYLPSAKLSLKILSLNDSHNLEENSNISLIERLGDAGVGTWPNVNIYLPADSLENKDFVFQKLNLAINNAPHFDCYYSEFQIGFVEKNKFANFNLSRYEKYERFGEFQSIPELKAYTFVTLLGASPEVKNIEKQKVSEQLKDNFKRGDIK